MLTSTQENAAAEKGFSTPSGVPAATPVQDPAGCQASAGKRELGKALGLWIHPFSRLHKIPVFKRVWLYLALMAAYTALVNWIADQSLPARVFKEAGAAAYSGVILGLLLVFRTNSAYERWYEGRKLWGQLVNDSRNLCLKVRAYVQASGLEKAQIGELIISFAYALKHHLRDSRPSQDLPGIGGGSVPEPGHLPVHVAGRVYETLWQWQQAGRVDGFMLLQLDRHARSFMDVCGACERIRGTPLAVSYRAFMRQGIALNLLALPWYMVPQFSICWSLPLILIGAYFLIGLELIAEDIEDPFGRDGDDLPLDAICANIRTTVNEILSVQEEQQYTRSLVVPRQDPLKERI